jgi:hypothetical protein
MPRSSQQSSAGVNNSEAGKNSPSSLRDTSPANGVEVPHSVLSGEAMTAEKVLQVAKKNLPLSFSEEKTQR